jgi:Polyphosphate kinase 2 (PPK2)
LPTPGSAGSGRTTHEDMISCTATKHAPWFVVPADHKWFTRIVVGASIIDAMERLDLAYPTLAAAALSIGIRSGPRIGIQKGPRAAMQLRCRREQLGISAFR